MQTERVTFLTSPDHKAALDAFAARAGKSVGHVVREATSRYVVDGAVGEEERFELLIRELDEAVPEMAASLDRSIAILRQTRAEVDEMLRAAGLRA